MTTLGEYTVAGGVQTGPFGSQLHASDYVASGVGVVMPQDITENFINPHAMARVSEQKAMELERHRLAVGDIVFSRRGDVTKRALIREQDGTVICGTGCLRVRLDSDRADSRYASYYLGTPEVRAWLVRHAVGATMPNLNTAILSSLPVALPGLEVQRRVGAVLGSLDDKITANQQVIARSGRFLAALFDSHMCGSVTVRLGEVASVNRRAVNPSLDGKIDYVDIGSVREGGFDAPTRMSWSDAPSRARRGLDSGDVLWSTVRPSRRSHALYLGSGSGVVASTGLAILSPVSVSSAELYEATKLPAFQGYLESLASGSAYPAVRSSVFNDAPLTVLENGRRQHFVKIAAPLRQLEWTLGEENLRLAATRDELLPLLMNGKITVKDAEKTVEDVV